MSDRTVAAGVGLALVMGAGLPTGALADQRDDYAVIVTAEDPELSGLPANGPDALYSLPPEIPQVQHHDPHFVAPFEMVSGTERYVDGEYHYTDYVYDDEGHSYPEDPDLEVYANNSADLWEFRMSTRGDDLLVRFALNTLLVEDSTIATLAFDTDQDATTGSDTLPRDPGMPFPGTDEVLTTWGTGAEWSRWNGSGWDSVPLDATTDLVANQITVTVPPSAAVPRGQWLATLATGVYDADTGGWLVPGADGGLGDALAGPAIVNLGFRFDGTQPYPRTENTPSDPAVAQNDALAAGEPTRYANLLDFDLLYSGGARDNVPTHGMQYRLFASRMTSVMVSTDGRPENGVLRYFDEGQDITSLHARHLSPIQPYALYVPPGYDPDVPAPMTFFLTCDGCYYWNANDQGNPYVGWIGTDRGSLVISTGHRGRSGFYVGQHEFDAFEAWNDVARHFTLDAQRPAVTGGSGGAYGAYRLSLLHPHLFARALAVAPAQCRGLWTIAFCSTGEETVLANWTENARHVPIFHVADMLSELTFGPGQYQTAVGEPINGYNSLESLGYEYRFWAAVTDHVGAALMEPPATEWLGQHVIEPEPFHVTFSRMPATDLPEIGLVHDRAYWLSDIRVRDDGEFLAKGVVDAVSLGFGRSDPESQQTQSAGVSGPAPYVEYERTYGEPGVVPVENRIEIDATNIGHLTIDPVGARVDCDVVLDVTTDGPLDVELLGCPTSVVTTSTPAGSGAVPAAGNAPVDPAPSTGSAPAADARPMPVTGSSSVLPGLVMLLAGALAGRNRRGSPSCSSDQE